MGNRSKDDVDIVPVQELDKAAGYELLDRQSRKVLGMSAADFIREYDAGDLSNGFERPEVMRLAMLIPFAR